MVGWIIFFLSLGVVCSIIGVIMSTNIFGERGSLRIPNRKPRPKPTPKPIPKEKTPEYNIEGREGIYVFWLLYDVIERGDDYAEDCVKYHINLHNLILDIKKLDEETRIQNEIKINKLAQDEEEPSHDQIRKQEEYENCFNTGHITVPPPPPPPPGRTIKEGERLCRVCGSSISNCICGEISSNKVNSDIFTGKTHDSRYKNTPPPPPPKSRKINRGTMKVFISGMDNHVAILYKEGGVCNNISISGMGKNSTYYVDADIKVDISGMNNSVAIDSRLNIVKQNESGISNKIIYYEELGD